MKLYPLKLNYIAKTALWGGSSLKEKYNKISDCEKLAETWELSVRKNEKSVIQNGIYEGRTLEDYIAECGSGVVGDGYGGERFPLLIKLIDACDSLSVQVHPDDEFAKTHEDDIGKTEMWYILDADEGAELVYGLCDGVDEERFARAIDENDYSSVLRRVKVKAGETYFIPAGMVHAIGAGIRIAEIQQNCDLTYRVYDFDRVGADGKKRELHIEKAKAAVKPISDETANGIRFEAKDESDSSATLAHCRYFKTDLEKISGEREFCADARSFTSILCIDGEGSIICNGEKYPISSGDSYFLPAAMGKYTLSGQLCALFVTL